MDLDPWEDFDFSKKSCEDSPIGTMKSEVVTEAVKYLQDKIVRIAKTVFPLKNRRPKGNKIYYKVRALMRSRKATSKRILKTKCPIALTKLRAKLEDLEAQIKNYYDVQRTKREEKILPAIKDDPQLFYSYH